MNARIEARRSAGLCCLVILLSAGAASAQSIAASQPASLDLAEPYIDGSFGFTIAPPAGCMITRQRRLGGAADVEVVQFASEAQHWTLTVRFTTTTQPLEAPEIIEGITRGVSTRFSDVKLLRGEEAKIDSREGLRYAASFVGDGTSWMRQQAVIRTKPTEYVALVFITPLASRDWAEPVFEKIVASFHIVRTEAMSKQIDEALSRGRTLLQSVSTARVPLSQRITPESFMVFNLDGKEIGYVWIREAAFTHNKRPGIEIQELAYLFKEDGSITQLIHVMQLTDDLQFEKWENQVKTLTGAKGQTPRHMIYTKDSGLRQDRKLIVAYMPFPNAQEMQDRIMDVNANYASAAWQSVLPRLIDLRQPQLYAFSSYNAERRGMVLRTIQAVGPTPVTVAGRQRHAIKLQDSEGLMPPISEIDVDDKGRIIRVLAGALEICAANKQDLQARYSSRVAEAESLLKKYPVKEPQPADRERSASPVPPQVPSPGVGNE